MVLDFLRALARRWYVVLTGLLLTSAAVYGAYQASPPEYHARGLVLLLPSQAQVGQGGNPFLQLSGLEQPAGILVAYFSSTPAHEEVKAVSPSALYQVGIDDSTRGPVIAVDVTAESAQDTLATLYYLVDRIPVELASLQQQVKAPANATIGSMALTVDHRATVDRANMLRLVIAALVAGLVATGAAGVAVDSLVQRRKTAQRPRAGRGPLLRRLRGARPQDVPATQTATGPRLKTWKQTDRGVKPRVYHGPVSRVEYAAAEAPEGANWKDRCSRMADRLPHLSFLCPVTTRGRTTRQRGCAVDAVRLG